MEKNNISAMIFDMDGVLWKEDTEIVNLKKQFKILVSNHIKFSFATNNGTKTPSDYQKKLLKFGIEVEEHQIITSGINLAEKLKGLYPRGGPIFLVGEPGLEKIMLDYNFYHQNDDVLAVVGGMDRNLDYKKLSQANILLNSGVYFFFTNIDPSFPTPFGNIPGAGALLAYLETASGRKADVYGKPHPSMFELALNAMKTLCANTLVIGDRLETDILGGINANCPTALVLTGISSREDIQRTNIHPNLINDNLTELIQELQQNQWKLNE